MEMKSHHFSLGSSTRGPVSYCARITASSEAEAIQRRQQIIRARSACENEGEFEVRTGEDGRHVEYLAIYLNPKVITTADIDDSDDAVVDDRPAVVCSVCTCETPRESASTRNGAWVCEDCLLVEAVKEESA
jgi:formylmethanofuran dehydrogenase subunit E